MAIKDGQSARAAMIGVLEAIARAYTGDDELRADTTGPTGHGVLIGPKLFTFPEIDRTVSTQTGFEDTVKELLDAIDKATSLSGQKPRRPVHVPVQSGAPNRWSPAT